MIKGRFRLEFSYNKIFSPETFYAVFLCKSVTGDPPHTRERDFFLSRLSED